MSTLLLIIIMISVLLLLILVGIDIAFAIGIVGILWLTIASEPHLMVVSRAFAGMNQFVLLAIPFFILGGEVMNKSGIAKRLIVLANLTVGRLKGGLAHANIGASLLFAGLSGSAVADVVAIGSVFIPEMEEEGYSPDFAAAVTAASSIIGPIIPPSGLIVLYGAMTNVSIGSLFAAAVIPGILLGVCLMVVTSVLAHRNDLPRYKPDVSVREYPRIAATSLLALTMPAIIVFGIVFGIFTVTEAAAVAVMYALVLGIFIYRSLSSRDIYDALYNAMNITGQLYILIGLAMVLAWLLAKEGFPMILAGLINDMGLGPIGFMILVTILFLILGTWLDIGAALIILAPTLHDIAMTLGIPPAQFGILMVLSLSYGLVTPPLGVCLFAVSSVADVDVWPIAKKVSIFYVANISALLLIIFIPELTMYIPETLDLA